MLRDRGDLPSWKEMYRDLGPLGIEFVRMASGVRVVEDRVK
jgi:hypothetical protein